MSLSHRERAQLIDLFTRQDTSADQISFCVSILNTLALKNAESLYQRNVLLTDNAIDNAIALLYDVKQIVKQQPPANPGPTEIKA